MDSLTKIEPEQGAQLGKHVLAMRELLFRYSFSKKEESHASGSVD